MAGIGLLFVSINLFAAAYVIFVEFGRTAETILRSQNQSKTPMHVCSLSTKSLKHDASYTSYEVMDFNHPENSLG